MSKSCEICGYTVKDKSTTVLYYPDGIWRCLVCIHKAVYGRFIPDREWDEMSDDDVEKLQAEWDAWEEMIVKEGERG